MKSVWTVVLGLAVILAFTVAARADDKEQTLKGTVTCAKCDLKLADKCATVIKTEDGTVYYFDPAGHKANHKAICTSPTEGTVTGVVSEKDGKKIVTVSKVELKK